MTPAVASLILRPSLTAQTKAFIAAVTTAGGSLTSGQAGALDKYLVRPLLSSGLWDTITALYPYIGGSAASHSINLKTPSAYPIIWSGTVTHGPNGPACDGSTGYGNTQIPQNALAQNAAHAMAYVVSNGAGLGVNFGRLWGMSSVEEFNIAFNATPVLFGRINDVTNFISATSTVSGFILYNRTDATNRELYSGGGVQPSTAASDAQSANTIHVFRGVSISGVVTTMAGFSCGASLSAAQVATYRGILQNYQSALGRAV